jgi:hypothetical protein
VKQRLTFCSASDLVHHAGNDHEALDAQLDDGPTALAVDLEAVTTIEELIVDHDLRCLAQQVQQVRGGRLTEELHTDHSKSALLLESR